MEKLGRLTPLEKVPGKGRAKWLCICDCGAEVVVSMSNLKSGNTKSCGCYATDQQLLSNTTHGQSRTRPHTIWKAMKGRCGNPNNSAYDNYGGRGITVCDSWQESFENFWEDMQEGYAPNLTLERVCINEGYSKENCRWATYSEQARHTRKRVCNKTGVTGVCFRGSRGALGAWIAQWMSLEGKVCSKESAVKKYGYDEAFRLAVIAREQAIRALNSRNANYNEEHGK